MFSFFKFRNKSQADKRFEEIMAMHSKLLNTAYELAKLYPLLDAKQHWLTPIVAKLEWQLSSYYMGIYNTFEPLKHNFMAVVHDINTERLELATRSTRSVYRG